MKLITLATLAAMNVHVEPPPAKYDYPPQQPYKVYVLPIEQVQKKCHITDKRLLGCVPIETLLLKPVAEVYIRNDLDKELFEVVLDHELAHINGWRH